MQTVENNLLIAQFMELTQTEENYFYNPDFERAYRSRDLKYHSSYDWLMPVVEKIESLGYYTSICKMDSKDAFYMKIFPNSKTYNYQDKFFQFHFVSPIEHTEIRIYAVWNAVIMFIKWHNEQQKS